MYSYFDSQNRNHDKLASAKVYCNEKYDCAKNKVKVSNTKLMIKCYKQDDVQKYIVCKFANKNIECYHDDKNHKIRKKIYKIRKKSTVITH